MNWTGAGTPSKRSAAGGKNESGVGNAPDRDARIEPDTSTRNGSLKRSAAGGKNKSGVGNTPDRDVSPQKIGSAAKTPPKKHAKRPRNDSLKKSAGGGKNKSGVGNAPDRDARIEPDTSTRNGSLKRSAASEKRSAASGKNKSGVGNAAAGGKNKSGVGNAPDRDARIEPDTSTRTKPGASARSPQKIGSAAKTPPKKTEKRGAPRRGRTRRFTSLSARRGLSAGRRTADAR